MAWIEKYETQEGTSFKVGWNVPRAMVPAGKRAHKEYLIVYSEATALRVKGLVEAVKGAIWRDAVAQQIEQELRPAGGQTFSEWAIEFLELKEGEIRNRTHRNYRTQLTEVILPEIGDVPLAALTGGDIKKFLNKIRKDRTGKAGRQISYKTCDRYFALIKHVLQVAQDNGKVDRNVAKVAGWKVNKFDPGAIEELYPERYFTPEQYERLLDAMRPDVRLFVRFLAETGARFSEVTNLKVGDLDFETSTAWIRFIEDDEGEMQLPKSGSKRAVEVPDDIMAALPIDGKTRTDLVFTTVTGAKINNPNFRRDHWDKVMVRLQQCPRHLPERIDGRNGLAVYDAHSPSSCACLGDQTWTEYTPHALRHTYATWMLMAGRSVTLVSKQLGHSSTKITEEIYVHLEQWWKHDAEARLSHTLKEVLAPMRERALAV